MFTRLSRGVPSEPDPFLREIFTRFPFTSEAQRFLAHDIHFMVRDRQAITGGGFWHPDRQLVELFTVQYEAAIHELAHAWWHPRRLVDNAAVNLMVAVVHLSAEQDPAFRITATLAHHYVYGITSQRDTNSPTGFWRGMLADGNDWEMFAGLSSGCMADIRLLPPYVREHFAGLFQLLPASSPSPLAGAPHR